MKKKKLLERMQDKKKNIEGKVQDRIQRGRVVTEQDKAERMRKKLGRAKLFEPGTFRYGLHYRQGMGVFLKDVKERRKQKREREDSEN